VRKHSKIRRLRNGRILDAGSARVLQSACCVAVVHPPESVNVQTNPPATLQQEQGVATRGAQAHARPPRVLVANDQEIWIWSLETILAPNGFSVSRATSASQVLEQVQATGPDVLIIHATLRDSSGIELCRKLREQQLITPATPVLITTSGPCRRADRLQVLRAGGWEYSSLPLDAEELLAKLKVYLGAKLSSDRAYAEGLIDPATGLYDVHGILMRIRELGLAARRHARALGCATVACGEPRTSVDRLPLPGEEPLQPDFSSRVPDVLRSVVRGSDVVGRLGQNEFVILAPETEMPGLLHLANRLVAAFEAEALISGTPTPVRVGCYAVPDFATMHIEPVEMIVRATQALRVAQLPGASPVQPFQQD
jgi:two-component system, cell cycle response regulator